MICVCNWRTVEKEEEKKDKGVTKGNTERMPLAGECELKNKKAIGEIVNLLTQCNPNPFWWKKSLWVRIK